MRKLIPEMKYSVFWKKIKWDVGEQLRVKFPGFKVKLLSWVLLSMSLFFIVSAELSYYATW